MDVKTNIGEKFLKLLDKHFPQGNPLHPLINRNKIKLSYSCLPNMGSVIARHNNKLTGKLSTPNCDVNTKTCNCQKPEDCPLSGNCIDTKNVVYNATIKTVSTSETYTGSTVDFKPRLANHKLDFRNINRKSNTTLSAYIWKLKESEQTPIITWKILGKAPIFSPVTNICQLCTDEKFRILHAPDSCTLNSRNELFTHCRHKKTLLLVKVRKKKTK